MDVPYEESMLDFDDEMEYPENSLNINGVDCAPATGVMYLGGQAGNGKTQTAVLIIATYLGATIPLMKMIWEGHSTDTIKVFYVDTEMEKGNTQLIVARIARLCNKNVASLKDNLKVMRLRDEDDHSMIWRKILKGINEIQPNVVVLDGMIDIIGDFNDNKEASRIIRKVMKVADHFNICMWTVMHQNPGSAKLVGHQGSFLDRKSAMGLLTRKVIDDKETGRHHFEIENSKQRGQDIPPLEFTMERFTLPNNRTNAYPVIKDKNQETVQEQEPDYDEFVRRVIPREGITTRDLRMAVEKEFKIGHSKADEMMWKLEDEKYVIRDKNKRYFVGDDSTQLNVDMPHDEAPY